MEDEKEEEVVRFSKKTSLLFEVKDQMDEAMYLGPWRGLLYL